MYVDRLGKPAMPRHALRGLTITFTQTISGKLTHFHSPGLIDIQINGAYGFDFSVYDGDDKTYKEGLKMIAERIVETGVTSCVASFPFLCGSQG